MRAYADGLLDGEGRERAVIVLGDLNDEPSAATTQILLGHRARPRRRAHERDAPPRPGAYECSSSGRGRERRDPSSAATKPTVASMRFDASRLRDPYDWVKTPSSSS